MILRIALAQARAISQCARATMEAVVDNAPHTPIEITQDGWFARFSFGWVQI